MKVLRSLDHYYVLKFIGVLYKDKRLSLVTGKLIVCIFKHVHLLKIVINFVCEMYICDMIKRNESDVANIDFEL